jgi:hypothetical protein
VCTPVAFKIADAYFSYGPDLNGTDPTMWTSASWASS